MKKLTVCFVVVFCLIGFSGIAGVHDHGNGHVCPVTGKKVTDKAEVEMTGEVLCMHCDLGEADSCHKIFVANDDEGTRYEICPEAEIDISKTHGPISVAGEKVTTEDGTMMLRVKSMEKVDESDS